MASSGLRPPRPPAAEEGFLCLEGESPRAQIGVSSRFSSGSFSHLRPALIIVVALSALSAYPECHGKLDSGFQIPEIQSETV